MFEAKMKVVGEYYALKTSEQNVALFKLPQHLFAFLPFKSQFS